MGVFYVILQPSLIDKIQVFFEKYFGVVKQDKM